MLAWCTHRAQKSLGIMEYRCNDSKMMEVQVSVEATEEHPAMNWFGRIKSKATVSE